MNIKHDSQFPRDISSLFKTAASKQRKKKKAKKSNASPFSLRLTSDERARLNKEAGNQPLVTYIRSRLLNEPSYKLRQIKQPCIDHKKLAEVLAGLGHTRLASNMNQLARAANMEALDVSDETINDLEEACQAISQMRETLIVALGVKPEGEQCSWSVINAAEPKIWLCICLNEDNDHVEVHEIRGFVSQNLMTALNEAYAISRATRCKQYLFSLSLKVVTLNANLVMISKKHGSVTVANG